MAPIRVAVLTISDGVAQGTRADRSGPRIAEWIAGRSYELVAHDVVPDQVEAIRERLIALVERGCDVVITTGGTGLTARDVTPEATAAVITRVVPGIAEALRAQGAAQTPYSWISRGVAGVRGSTLIVNLPGSETAVGDGLQLLERLVEHAVQLLRGIQTDKH